MAENFINESNGENLLHLYKLKYMPLSFEGKVK